MAAQLRLDVVHAPSNRGLCAFAPCPTVLTRHDAIERMFPPDFPGTWRSRFRTWYSDEISIRCATRVITVSETSRRDIISTWRLSPKKVVAAGEGINERFFSAVPKSRIENVLHHFGVKPPYILYVGGLDRRKDIPTLVEAFHLTGGLGRRLVIAGPMRGELAAIDAAINRYTLDSTVMLLGEVDDDQLHALYGGADCFVYPSRYEGFGLQAAEALAMRVPLVVSDGGALPEVSGGHALMFRTGDASDLAKKIAECLDDDRGRETRITAGAKYAERFHWTQVVDEYVAL